MGLRRSSRFLAAAIFAGCISIALAGCSSAPSDEGSLAGDAVPPSPTASAIDYEFELVGDLDDDLRSLLEDSSQLIRLQERPPAGLAGLRRRVNDDLERLATALRSEGYYDHSLTDHMTGSGTEADPVQVTIAVEPGPRFALGYYQVTYRGPVPDIGALDAERDLGLVSGAPAESAAIVEAERRLLRRHANSGYPFAKVQDDRFVIDRASRTLNASVVLDAGSNVAFGPLQIAGLELVDEAYLRRLIAWRPGTQYDPRVLEKARETVSKTGLFTAVIFKPAETADAAGQVPVTLEVTERPRRSLGFGVGFSTDETFDVDVFWEHRNWSGEGENLRLEARATEVQQEASVRFAKPNFRKLGQTLIASTTGRHEDSDAFNGWSITQFIGAERLLSPGLTFTSGPVFEVSRIDDQQETDSFALVGFSMDLNYDSRDDPLDPSEGWHLGIKSEPFVSVFKESTQFWSNEATAATYYSLDDEGWIVLAGRATLGAIVGDSDQGIPANRRFYAGGAGSVRGYEFRTVGPLDAEDDPLGGRSIAVINLETRIRVTEQFGIVPFLDGGQVYEDPWIDLGEELLWAGGLGLRYFSPIGPLRLDVAMPINGRDDVDDDFEFYISIGQAF